MTRVLIIVQNLPVPFDRRVWLECQALVSDGYQVSVVCPKGKADPAYQVIDHVELYKYRPYAPRASSALSPYAPRASSALSPTHRGQAQPYHRVRLFFPRDGLADVQGETVRPVRGDAGLQPA